MAAFPATRMRRNRRAPWSRALVAETRLSALDLIWPVFVIEGEGRREPVPSMPGVERLSSDLVIDAAGEAAALGIPAIALFPYVEPELKTPDGDEAINADNLVCRTIRRIKAAHPGLGVICDVALDPFSSHGHDGVCRDGRILNDESVAILCRQAVVQAEAGCDVVAPSDMMDGRVGAIRDALDRAGFSRNPDHGLRGEVRLGLLRPVPRRHRLVGRAGRRQEDLPDGSGAMPWRRCARSRSTSRRAPTW